MCLDIRKRNLSKKDLSNACVLTLIKEICQNLSKKNACANACVLTFVKEISQKNICQIHGEHS